MLENIHIQNFRCFEDFKAEGFERINLIGGKNNSGKTCLIEALFVTADVANFKLLLNETRRADFDIEKVQNLFFNRNISMPISIEFDLDKNLVLSKLFRSDIESINLSTQFQKKYYNADYLLGTTLQLPAIKNLSIEFNDLDRAGYGKIILETIQIIDSTIAEIKTYSDRPDLIFLRKINENKFFPMNYFGDAVRLTLRYVLSIVRNQSKELKVILIDEIENGIHYSAHYDFWKALFTLSKELNVQIFATTHSKEMIEQFNIVSKEFELLNNEKTGAYFEMMRNVRTNKIVAHKYEANELEYSLDNEKTFRGE